MCEWEGGGVRGGGGGLVGACVQEKTEREPERERERDRQTDRQTDREKEGEGGQRGYKEAETACILSLYHHLICPLPITTLQIHTLQLINTVA